MLLFKGMPIRLLPADAHRYRRERREARGLIVYYCYSKSKRTRRCSYLFVELTNRCSPQPVRAVLIPSSHNASSFLNSTRLRPSHCFPPHLAIYDDKLHRRKKIRSKAETTLATTSKKETTQTNVADITTQKVGRG